MVNALNLPITVYGHWVKIKTHFRSSPWHSSLSRFKYLLKDNIVTFLHLHTPPPAFFAALCENARRLFQEMSKRVWEVRRSQSPGHDSGGKSLHQWMVHRTDISQRRWGPAIAWLHLYLVVRSLPHSSLHVYILGSLLLLTQEVYASKTPSSYIKVLLSPGCYVLLFRAFHFLCIFNLAVASAEPPYVFFLDSLSR